VSLPSDRPIDGKDIFPLLSSNTGKSPHEAILALGGPELKVVRSGKWKLHVRTPSPGFQYLSEQDAAKWVDPRGPDGLTIIAQSEQARPNQYPGVRTGDEGKPMMLFDLDNDPSEQNNVADSHPEVVKRLKAYFDTMDAQATQQGPPERHGSGGIRRLKGGQLRYDMEIKPNPKQK
jgi:uncharacterized sulfatase